MIDKITAKIKRYPFQTGIVCGILAFLILWGFISLFQDHGKTLAGNSEIIQQDYLRMTINEYAQNNDELLADWRYRHLGGKAAETLKLMSADETISARQLVSFAEAIGKSDVLGKSSYTSSENAGTPANPRKGLSGFGKVLLVLLGVVVAAAGALYVVSLLKTKNKQKRRADAYKDSVSEPVNMITPEKARTVQSNEPDTLFDLDSLFPQGGAQPVENSEPEHSGESSEKESLTEDADIKDDLSETAYQEEEPDGEKQIRLDDREIINEKEMPGSDFDDQTSDKDEVKDDAAENDFSEEADADVERDEDPDEGNGSVSDDAEEPGSGLLFDDIIQNIENTNFASQKSEEINGNELSSDEGSNAGDDEMVGKVIPNDSPEEQKSEEHIETKTEKPLIETDPEIETENEDELLKIIRSSAVKDEPGTDPDHDGKTVIDTTENSPLSDQDKQIVSEPEPENTTETSEDVLIHYQSVYRIGNDMYDEVFSIDQGDLFRGECGIGIGETLNNTEPKAVTAFEVWLFDKDDIHTATWYLMSDFALENEGISKRLEQRGKCDRIRKNDVYVLETETLIVEIKVLDLEYGNEMEEKNSYFTNVTFDVIARSKKTSEPAE